MNFIQRRMCQLVNEINQTKLYAKHCESNKKPAYEGKVTMLQDTLDEFFLLEFMTEEEDM